MKRFSFPVILAIMAMTCCCQCTSDEPIEDRVNEKPVTILEEEEVERLTDANVDAGFIEAMVEAIRDQAYPNIHSVLIAKEGALVFERYFRGSDQNWGTNLGLVQHSKGTLHDVRSISKSIVSACIGIALDQGKIQSVQQGIFDFFPDYVRYNTESSALITIEHLLTMTSGLGWDETSIPYTNPANSEIQMTNSENPIAFVLGHPMVAEPGEVFNYSGGDTQLLAGIIAHVSGMEVDAFAEEFLFKPLGIDYFEWNKYSRSGLPAAASGLRLRSGDMMKIALLFHHEGEWEGSQVVSASWVEESFKSHVSKENPNAYFGYAWHILPSFQSKEKTITLVAGVGNGDQRIFFDKENDLVVVVTAGNYNLFYSKNALALMKDFVYPSFL